MSRSPRPPSATRNSPRSVADEGLPWVLMSLEASPLAAAVPGLVRIDPHGPGITRVRATVVRLIDLGMFRIGGEKYAELDHHYGATTLQKQHVHVTRDGILFDYTAKWGKQRTIVIRDSLVQPTVRALARVDNDLDP